MKLVLDLSLLTLNDYIEFEAETQSSVTEALGAMAKGRASAVEQRGLVWIFCRKLDPHFTIADAGSFHPSDIEWDLPSTEAES